MATDDLEAAGGGMSRFAIRNRAGPKHTGLPPGLERPAGDGD